MDRRNQRSVKTLAAVIAMIFFFAAILRLPGLTPANYRLYMIGLFNLMILFSFVCFLWVIVNKWVALFLLLAIVSRGFPLPTEVAAETFEYIVYGIIWYCVVFFTARHVPDYYLDALCVIALANTMALIVQHLPIRSWYVGVPSGLMSNPNETSTCLAMCLPACFRPGRTWFIPVVLTGLVLSKSFGGVLAASFGLIFFGYMQGGIVITTTLVLAGLVGFYLFIDKPATVERLEPWQRALELYPQRWLMGCGLGHWKVAFVELAKAGQFPQGYVRLHNTFIQGMMEMGIGFAVIVVGYLVDTIRRFNRGDVLPAMALVAIIVCSSVNSMFRMNAINAGIAVMWLGVLEASLRGTVIEMPERYVPEPIMAWTRKKLNNLKGARKCLTTK